MKEIRSNENINIQSESRTVEGYAVVFNSESVDLGGFTEIINPGAITEDVINNSDILFLLDHSRERGLLARSKNGSGSLKVEIDERGVKYSFEAPNTALGDEVLEGLKRGDINKCSFAFTVSTDSWVKRADGSILRTIESIDKLYDMSIVYNPAYEDTIVVNKRGLDELTAEDEKESDTVEERCNLYNKNTTINSKMNKNKFSVMAAIRSVVDKSTFDENTLNVIKEGRAAAAQSGIAANGQIVLPVEMREDPAPATPAVPAANGLMATEATLGKEAVPTDMWDIMGALRDRLVLAQAGAQFITASGNIEIPVYDGSSVFWESEIGEAQDGAGKFSKVTLSPKRLTAFVDISKQLINQTSASVEQMIREDLINAVAEKLQKTILGNGAGDATTPKGLFNGVTADTAAFTYNDAVDMEAALEDANVYGDFKYIVNPQTKAALRVLSVDKGSGRFVYENDEVLGIDAFSTNSVVTKGAILGDFKQLVVANFGALDITVDEVSRAAFGQIRLVVNFYVDYACKRDNAFVKRILK